MLLKTAAPPFCAAAAMLKARTRQRCSVKKRQHSTQFQFAVEAQLVYHAQRFFASHSASRHSRTAYSADHHTILPGSSPGTRHTVTTPSHRPDRRFLISRCLCRYCPSAPSRYGLSLRTVTAIHLPPCCRFQRERLSLPLAEAGQPAHRPPATRDSYMHMADNER